MSAAASAVCMLVMRAAMGPAATSSSRSVAGRPGVTSVAPETTKGLPEPARPVGERLDGPGVGPRRGLGHAGHDEGQVDDAVAVEGAGAQHVGVVQVAAQHLGAHVGDGWAEASERASPRTWWPAPMSSGTTAEPIQPEAPVTKMRMEVSLVCLR